MKEEKPVTRELPGPGGWKILVRATSAGWFMTGQKPGRVSITWETKEADKVQDLLYVFRAKLEMEEAKAQDLAKVMEGLE